MLSHILILLLHLSPTTIDNSEFHLSSVVKKEDRFHTKQDSVAYLTSNIINLKHRYIGKKLKKLINRSQIKPRSITYSPNFVKSSDIYYISLYYYPFKIATAKEFKEKTPFLVITFLNPIPNDELAKVAVKTQFEFTPELFNYLKKFIVKDIELVK